MTECETKTKKEVTFFDRYLAALENHIIVGYVITKIFTSENVENTAHHQGPGCIFG